MSPPHRSGCWRPVDRLADLDVGVAWPDSQPGPVVELVDKRLWTELVSMNPVDALELSDRIRDAAVRAAVARGTAGSTPAQGRYGG